MWAGMAEVVSGNDVDSAGDVLVAHKCTLRSVNAINKTAAVAHVALFDAAATASVTLGTTNPRWVVTMPASQAVTELVGDLIFENGIVAYSTTTIDGTTSAATKVRLGII